MREVASSLILSLYSASAEQHCNSILLEFSVSRLLVQGEFLRKDFGIKADMFGVLPGVPLDV